MNNNYHFSHILLCNVLTTILRPNFGEPVDTVKQLVERNITLFLAPYSESWKTTMIESPIPYYKEMGENSYICKDWDECDNYAEFKVFEGTHAYLTPWLYRYELDFGRWWRSKDQFVQTPFYGFLSNKKFHLREVNTSY